SRMILCWFGIMTLPPPSLTLFPYTTLFRSITKLMTAMVVLDAKLSLDEMITVNSEDRDMLKNTYSRVRMGSKLSRREMLKLALRSEEHTSELQSREKLVCRLLLERKKRRRN